MAALNKPIPFTETTHGGAPAVRMTEEQALRRSVMACMLWEREFYEDGVSIADRIADLAQRVPVSTLARLAIEVRTQFHLRHVPLLLLAVLADREEALNTSLISDTIEATIQRPDEITEFLVIYAQRNGVTPDKLKGKLRNQIKDGLGAALRKFGVYSLAKYDRPGAVRFRDVLRLCHPRPGNEAQAALWKVLAKGGSLPAPDTWEVALSSGADKRETWTRLLRDRGLAAHRSGVRALGYMALLRNLRNMLEVGVDRADITAALLDLRGSERVLPFRFLTAARIVPALEPVLEAAMFASLAGRPKLPGRTLWIVDISGSMAKPLSSNSEVTRISAALSLVIVGRELCEDVAIYATAGDDRTRTHATGLVPPRRGVALADAVIGMSQKLGGGGIFMTPALRHIRDHDKGEFARIVMVTDEQDTSSGDRDSPRLAEPFGTRANYLINVASARNGIGYGKWLHMDGISDAVFNFMLASEGLLAQQSAGEDDGDGDLQAQDRSPNGEGAPGSHGYFSHSV